MDAQYIIYTGVPTSTIPIAPNQNLQLILQNIDAAINAHNTAPDYSGYNLFCVKETDGVTHPTNAQNFAEGISKMLCDLQSAYITFTGTTYVADQAVLVAGINALDTPGLTYVPFSITNTDTMTQVWNKSFTGFTGIINSIKPDSANWASIGAGATTSIVSAFNTIIAYELTQDALIAAKEASIGTFNNTANCLSGGATDSPRTTISSIITYLCSLPTFDAGSITWGGVSAGTDLQTAIQNTVNALSTQFTNAVVAPGLGLVMAAVSGTYDGQKLSIDTTWTGLYKVAVSGTDTTPNHLVNKIVAGTGITINTLSPGGDEQLEIVNSSLNDNKVKIDSSDTNAGYLQDKLTGTTDTTWGLTNFITPTQTGDRLILAPTIGNPSLLWQNMMTYIASDPTLLAQFANLVAISSSAPGAAISDLSATLSTSTFVLTWTPQAGVSQLAKWRTRGTSLWITTDVSPANPLSDVANTTTFLTPVTNIPYQVQVDTIYVNGVIGSNISEAIYYTCASISTNIASGHIKVTQAVLPGIDTIEYQLWDSGPSMVDAITALGSQPIIIFGAQPSGNYTVKWRYGTSINGSVLYSDDASQLGAYCTSGTIVIP